MADSPSADGDSPPIIPPRLFQPQQSTPGGSPPPQPPPVLPDEPTREELVRRAVATSHRNATQPAAILQFEPVQYEPADIVDGLVAAVDFTTSYDEELPRNRQGTGGMGVLRALSVGRERWQELYVTACELLGRSPLDMRIMDFIFGAARAEDWRIDAPGYQQMGSFPALTDAEGREYSVGNFPTEGWNSLSIRIPKGRATRELDFPRPDSIVTLKANKFPIFPYVYVYNYHSIYIIASSHQRHFSTILSIQSMPPYGTYRVASTGSHRETSAVIRLLPTDAPSETLLAGVNRVRADYSNSVIDLLEAMLMDRYPQESFIGALIYLHDTWATSTAKSRVAL